MFVRRGDVVYMRLRKRDGRVFWVQMDAEDWPRVRPIPGKRGWWVQVRVRHFKEELTVAGRVDGKCTHLGRYILGLNGNTKADHIDGDHLNARRSNLREVTNAQNAWNRDANGNGRFLEDRFLLNRFLANGFRPKGVCESGVNQFEVKITVNGCRYCLGSGFKTVAEAALAYDVMAVRLHGRCARLNIQGVCDYGPELEQWADRQLSRQKGERVVWPREAAMRLLKSVR